MPCYLFTYHTYGSWMPDRPQGYVKRHEGIQPQDMEAAKLYYQAMNKDAVAIDEDHQRKAINALLDSASYHDLRIHSVATEPTHLHVVVSWHNEGKPWEKIRTSLKRSMTMTLQNDSEVKDWFSRGSSRKQVKDREHFEHLVNVYLLSHSGLKWDEKRGFYKHSDDV